MSAPDIQAVLLGTGSSGGVPRIGGDWGACDPTERRNRRLRCSAIVEAREREDGPATRILIDTSPDLREQLLSAEVSALDAVFFSHDHADQTHGLDDLRVIAMLQRAQVPVYLDAPTAETLVAKFRYCFEGAKGYPSILAREEELRPGQPVSVSGGGGVMQVIPLEQRHGPIRSLGFRIGGFAYCNDVSVLPEETLTRLAGVDTFVVDALRYRPHPTHAHLDLALEWIARLAPRRAVLTNLHVDMDYHTLLGELPAGVEPGYDGMRLRVEACG